MSESRVVQPEAVGDLTVLEVESNAEFALWPSSPACCLVMSEKYVSAGRVLARHYLTELDGIPDASESMPARVDRTRTRYLT